MAPKIVSPEDNEIKVSKYNEPPMPKQQREALKNDFIVIKKKKKEEIRLAKLKLRSETIKCKNALKALKQKSGVSAEEINSLKVEQEIKIHRMKLSYERLVMDTDIMLDKLRAEWMDEKKFKKYKKRKGIRKDVWTDRNLYLMVLPFVIFLIVFEYVPMYGLQIAFKDYSPFKGIWESPWAPENGLYYFKFFLNGPYAKRLFTNTILINVYQIIFAFPLPIIFALLLNELRSRMFKTSIQTISYLPHFVSSVVVAGLVVNFLSPSTGIINIVYTKLTGNDPIYFLADPKYFRTIFVTMGIWQGLGFSSIIFASALVGIDAELYEAARIDGANRWQQLLHITIPGLLPTVSIMLILRIGNLLNVGFETIILLYQPATYVVADVISSYVYRSGIQEGNYALATAVGLFNGIIALILVLSANWFSRKIGDIGLW